MIRRVVVLYGNRRSTCVRWSRDVSVGLTGDDDEGDRGLDEERPVLRAACAYEGAERDGGRVCGAE